MEAHVMQFLVPSVVRHFPTAYARLSLDKHPLLSDFSSRGSFSAIDEYNFSKAETKQS